MSECRWRCSFNEVMEHAMSTLEQDNWSKWLLCAKTVSTGQFLRLLHSDEVSPRAHCSSTSVAARPSPVLAFGRLIHASPCNAVLNWVKDHRQRIPRFVIRRYLEKSIQKKLFCHLQSLQNKDYFPRKKTIINSISENLLSRFIYGRDVIGANCVEQRRPENGKNDMFLLLQLLLLQPNATQ